MQAVHWPIEIHERLTEGISQHSTNEGFATIVTSVAMFSHGSPRKWKAETLAYKHVWLKMIGGIGSNFLLMLEMDDFNSIFTSVNMTESGKTCGSHPGTLILSYQRFTHLGCPIGTLGIQAQLQTDTFRRRPTHWNLFEQKVGCRRNKIENAHQIKKNKKKHE